MSALQASKIAAAVVALLCVGIGTYVLLEVPDPVRQTQKEMSFGQPSAVSTAELPDQQQDSQPPSSGEYFHPLELLQNRPFPIAGKTIVLDVVTPPYYLGGNAVTYRIPIGKLLLGPITRAASFSQTLDPATDTFDVIVESSDEDEQAEHSSVVGTFALDVNGNQGPPTPDRPWVVEYKGVKTVTMSDGTMKSLPLLKFWGYFENGR